ncbi:MAG: helix-turn-helix domain-containing protein [Nostocaceae cyanobacterium]|nr:helix-turn-helix domain-containing protein [Nostocaceae cyanobacterium]
MPKAQALTCQFAKFYTNFIYSGYTYEKYIIIAIAIMSGVVKIEISESVETLKEILKKARTPQEKERIQTIYCLKTKTVKTVKQITVMLGHNRVTVQKWLQKYRQKNVET